MGRFDFVSPGAAAGSAIEDILTKRRDEQRRAMLDELSVKGAETNRRATEANIEAQRQRQERETLEQVLPTLEQDDSVENHPQRALLEKYGYLGKKPTPNVETSTSFAAPDGMGDFVTQGGEMSLPGGFNADNTTPQPPSGAIGNFFFKGTQKQREDNKRIARVNELRAQLSNPNLSRQERAGIMMQAEAEHIDMSGPAWSAVTRDPQETVVFDEATGTFKDAAGKVISKVPENAKVERQRRAPAGPRGPAPVLFKDSKTGKRSWITPGQPVPEGYVRDSGNQSQQQHVVPAALRTNLNMWRAKMGEKKPGAADGFYQAQQSIISDYSQRGLASPDVVSAIRDVMDDLNVPEQTWGDYFTNGSRDNKPPTYDEIVQGHEDNFFSTPEELEQFKDLLSNIL